MATKFVRELHVHETVCKWKKSSLQEEYVRNKGGGSFYLDISLFGAFGYETRAEPVFSSDQETFKAGLKVLKRKVILNFAKCQVNFLLVW